MLGEGPQGRSEIYTIRPHAPKSNIQPSSYEPKVLNKVQHCIIYKGFKWQFFKLLIFSCCSLVESLKMGRWCHDKAHFNMNIAKSLQPRNDRSVTPVVEHRHLFKLHLKAWLIPNRPIGTSWPGHYKTIRKHTLGLVETQGICVKVSPLLFSCENVSLHSLWRIQSCTHQFLCQLTSLKITCNGVREGWALGINEHVVIFFFCL